jgi:hypothetical protein
MTPERSPGRTAAQPIPGTGAGAADGADWLAAQAAQRPRAVTRAGQIIAAGGRSNDACLHARQFLERALGAGPDAVFTFTDYRQAADWLHGARRAEHGDILETLASTDAELRAARPAWEQRYAGRPETAAERDAGAQIRTGAVVERGEAGQGVDGAWYTRAWYTRSSRPAIVVTTSALTEEVVAFASTDDAGNWLKTRDPAATGPLVTTATGPFTRAAREEELLAFLVRQPGDARSISPLVSPRTWTTHLRAELFEALQWLTSGGGRPGFGVVAEAFTRRLLRAPGWAAGDIGWPGASRAMAYLQRLAATPVTAAQAFTAAQKLAGADAAALSPAPGISPSFVPGATTAQRKPPTAPRVPLLQPPPGQVPGPGAPVLRM